MTWMGHGNSGRADGVCLLLRLGSSHASLDPWTADLGLSRCQSRRVGVSEIDGQCAKQISLALKHRTCSIFASATSSQRILISSLALRSRRKTHGMPDCCIGFNSLGS